METRRHDMCLCYTPRAISAAAYMAVSLFAYAVKRRKRKKQKWLKRTFFLEQNKSDFSSSDFAL